MPLVKDTSYREMPYSSETPNDDFHQFMSLKQVTHKVSKHQNHVYRCRTVGVVYSQGQLFTMYELNDWTVHIRLSLMYMKEPTPYAGIPFTAQLFGFVHWRVGIGPCMYANHLAYITPATAQTLRSTMQWLIESHQIMNPNAGCKKYKALPSTSAGASPEAAGSDEPAAEVARGVLGPARSIWDE